MTIALLCPTRGRPYQCKRMIDSALVTAHNRENVKIFLAFTRGDKSIQDYDHRGSSHQFLWPDYPTAFKWNKLAEIAIQNDTNRLFMLTADDTIFSTPCWDRALMDHYNNLSSSEESKIHAYHFLDSRDPNGTPHPIVTREYIEAMGYFLPPWFMHWFVDTWTVGIAKDNHCFTHMKDYQLLHDKPSDIGIADETHNRIRDFGWHDRDKWVHDHCQHIYQQESKRLLQCLIDSVPLGRRHWQERKSRGWVA